jgi:hypothetical protein
MPQHGRSKVQQDALERHFGTWPVVEAEHELRVILLDQDLEGAVPGDPERCVLAQACKRMGFSYPLFFRTRAYLALPDEGGNMRVERFMIPEATARAIRRFDITGTMPVGGFRITPPTKSQTLEYQRLKTQRLSDIREAAGQPRKRRPQGPRTDALSLEGVRWGTTVPHHSTNKGGPKCVS